MLSKKQETIYASKLKEYTDLSSPLHDEIQIWVMKNKATLYKKLFSMTTNLEMGDVDKYVQYVGCEVEYPVLRILDDGSFGKSIVGYMDVVLNNTPFGGKSVATRFSFFIEIKTKITSFGKIMRELQFYDTHLSGIHKSHIVLLAPSIPNADMIREQGFTVLEYIAGLFEDEDSACSGTESSGKLPD